MNLLDNNNEPFDLKLYQGGNSLLLVFFRGAWCNHCKKQLQDIQNHLNEFDKVSVKILALSSDTKFNSSLLKSFLRLDFPVLSDDEFALIDSYALRTVYQHKQVSKPAVFLLNPAGETQFSYIGEDYDDRLSAEKILEQLKTLL